MATRSFIIRLIANLLYLLRYSTLRSSKTRFLVFTGTSGKTLARSATAFALKKAGYHVSSLPYGYTNELGIVLTALGIEEGSLFTPGGLWRVLTAKPPKDLYACIELGADWRVDTGWFLRRFRPYGVCIVNVSKEEWTRPLPDIWDDKGALVASVPGEGFIAFSSMNESVSKIRTLATKARVCEFSAASETFRSSLSELLPYREAFGFAAACMKAVGAAIPREDLFINYPGVEERLRKVRLASGATLIADTYKAVPQCTEFVLDLALTEPAQKRIAVVSAMHPLWKNEEEHYRKIALKLQRFDEAYFIGPERIHVLLSGSAPDIRRLREHEYPTLADRLNKEGTDTVIVIKGAGRYHLENVVSMLSELTVEGKRRLRDKQCE